MVRRGLRQVLLELPDVSIHLRNISPSSRETERHPTVIAIHRISFAWSQGRYSVSNASERQLSSCKEFHLCACTGIQKVAAGALVYVPGRQQAQRAVPSMWSQVVLQVVYLVLEIGMAQHDTLRRHSAHWTHSFQQDMLPWSSQRQDTVNIISRS